MRRPRYRFTPKTGDENIEGFLRSSMASASRCIELIFYTSNHALADAQYDELLQYMREHGWKIELQE